MAGDAKTVVIGAGIGGLTAAALLVQAGHDVTVLEAQVYPGGSAGTYSYQGYRFDAGATVAGGFNVGGPHWRVAQQLGIEWPVKPIDGVAWSVHLPDGRRVDQWTDRARWQQEYRRHFAGSERFWQRQEMLADISWDVSSRDFPWPPQNSGEAADLALALRPKTLLATPYILGSIGRLLPADDPLLKLFVDANLLISAQTTSDHANALYGSAALDLPRRGVNNVQGGIGRLADTLVDAIRAGGGQVLFRQKVDRIDVENGRAVRLWTAAGRRRGRQQFEFDNLVANLTPWTLAKLLGPAAPRRLRREIARRDSTWGAFMLYLGVRADKLPAEIADHHQIIEDSEQPLGETNSVFVSISDPDDLSRAPAGMRTVNISTHTEIEPWWRLRYAEDGEAAYLDRREAYSERMIDLVESRIPGFKSAIELQLPATPVTYETWTGRHGGMVGGFAQTSIFDARGPRTGVANAWLVGDSVFPGQSTAGVTLSALRVARLVRRTTRSTKTTLLRRLAPTA